MNPITKPESAQELDYQTRYEQLIEQLRRYMGAEMKYVNIWLNSPHPDLGGVPPQAFINAGKIEVVESLAWAIEHGLLG